jgi:predicted transcriptional regulator
VLREFYWAGANWICERSGVSRATLVAIERGTCNPIFATVGKLVSALENAGIELIDENHISQARGVGVRLKS